MRVRNTLAFTPLHLFWKTLIKAQAVGKLVLVQETFSHQRTLKL